MGWKPKSCGTKTRRHGLQKAAPPKAAYRTVRGGLPLDSQEGTSEKTSWTLSACGDSLRVSSTSAWCSCGAMAVVDQYRLCVGMLETFARFWGHCRSVAARMSGFNVT